jgi:hypothetical protein
MFHAPIKQGASTLAIIAIWLLTAGCFTPAPTRKPQDLGGQHVSFTTSDGVLLRGHLYGTGSTGVILAHMTFADSRNRREARAPNSPAPICWPPINS